MNSPTLANRSLSLVQSVLMRWRYIKFGLVGASGTVVNLAVLYVCQEFLLAAIASTEQRLYASLAIAILLATVNNFAWNRLWTWRDRQAEFHGGIATQFVRYGLASWLGTSVQYIMTLWLAQHVHYLVGNVLAIVLASVINYFANDWWTFKGNPREVSDDERTQRYQSITLGLLVLALAMYVFDLGGENIPRNGDELVYAHIAFKTWLQAQATGAWLPLASDLDHMRNTKPPLLFWQAMLMPWLGLEWKLLWLRVPSLLYTLANTVLVVWAARALALDQLRQKREPLSFESVSFPRVLNANTLGFMAGLIFLGCFSTYRYGRPYLTSAIETFWMNLPFWWLLCQVLRARRLQTETKHTQMGHSVFAVAGISWGVVALYKSFVLIAPLAGTLFVSLCWLNPTAWRRWFVSVALSTAFALGLFALWFVVDPDPMGVWREFVVGENWGKVSAGGPSYLQTALVGGFSIWVQALGLLQNGAMLGPLIMGVALWGMWHMRPAWRARLSGVVQPQAVLWLYVLLLSLFFMVPSQRSARYLIPLMPVMSVLCALWLWRLPQWAQRTAMGLGTMLSLCGLAFLGLFLWAGWRVDLYPLWGRLGLLLILALQVLALLRLFATLLARQNAPTLQASWIGLFGLVLSLFAWFGMLSAPLHTAANTYAPEVVARVQGATLATPSNFNGDFERWRFLIPGVGRITPYMDHEPNEDQDIAQRLKKFDAVVVHRYWNEAAPDCAQAHCEILAQRIGLRGRHAPGEITWKNLQTPERVLFWHEYLLVSRP
jgi:putative flippase GtrA